MPEKREQNCKHLFQKHNNSDKCPLVLLFCSNVSANLPLALLYGVCESPHYQEGSLPIALQVQSGVQEQRDRHFRKKTGKRVGEVVSRGPRSIVTLRIGGS